MTPQKDTADGVAAQERWFADQVHDPPLEADTAVRMHVRIASGERFLASLPDIRPSAGFHDRLKRRVRAMCSAQAHMVERAVPRMTGSVWPVRLRRLAGAAIAAAAVLLVSGPLRAPANTQPDPYQILLASLQQTEVSPADVALESLREDLRQLEQGVASVEPGRFDDDHMLDELSSDLDGLLREVESDDWDT